MKAFHKGMHRANTSSAHSCSAHSSNIYALLVKFARPACVVLIFFLVLSLVCGCVSSASLENAASTNNAATTTAASTIKTASELSTTSTYEDAISGFNTEYSNRDQDASYDEASATKIECSDTQVNISGDGASVQDGIITISEEGTYIVSGSLSQGQIYVECSDTEKVQIVLAGIVLHNETGPAIYIKTADKVFITLADGSTNTLTDGATYTLEEDSDEPYACVFSKCDLTFNGNGTLKVTSNYRHGICSKDDLTICGGTYVVDAAEDGIRGRDSIMIQSGNFTVTAKEDAFKVNNDEDEDKGFLIIDGGTFEVSAGDDAFHAERLFAINDGEVNVSTCYEGYEAQKVYINGGTTHIVATDDALNASEIGGSSESADAFDPSLMGNFEAGEGEGEGKGEGANNMQQGAPNNADGGMQGQAQGTAPNSTDNMQGGAGGNMQEPPSGGMGPTSNGNNNQQAPTAEDGQEPPELPSQDAQGLGIGGTGGAGDMQNGSDGAGNMGAMGAAGGMGGFEEGSEDCLVEINGGYTVLDASGDGIDSNGYFVMHAGCVLVCGPTNDGNGAFDCALTSSISGGELLMVGSSGMAQNLSGGTQSFFMQNVSGSANSNVAIVDAQGNVLISFTPSKQFSCVQASSASFASGQSYSIVVGGNLSNANADGYASSGSVTGGTTTSVTVS